MSAKTASTIERTTALILHLWEEMGTTDFELGLDVSHSYRVRFVTSERIMLRVLSAQSDLGRATAGSPAADYMRKVSIII
jgi:hypothetical protein